MSTLLYLFLGVGVQVMLQTDRVVVLQERQQARLRREQQRQVAEENQRLAEEQRNRRQRDNHQYTYNKPEETFFDQFNRTTR